MRRMKHAIFTGSAAAVVTPMDAQGRIDYKAMKRLLEFQIENGTDALVINGTTGESATLRETEKLELLEFAVDAADGRVPIIAGTGSNCTKTAIGLSQKAQKVGAAGLLVVTPYYNKATQRGLEEHFRAVADSVEIPIILYNVPGRTGVSIKPQTYFRLSAHPNIYGVKEAGGNFSDIAQTAALCGDALHLYSGNDDQTVPILSLGGKGVISVLANVMPERTHEMCRLFFEGRTEESRKIQLETLDLISALFSEVNPIPVKAALSMMGLCQESYRLPLTTMELGKREALFQVMKKHSLIRTDTGRRCG